MKKIIPIIFLFLIVFVIYVFNVDRKVKYLYIGNTTYSNFNKMIKNQYDPEQYVEYVRDDDYRVMDLISEIEYNNNINNKQIQNLLIKSNIIVISTGLYDIEYKKELDYKYVDELIIDIEKLLTAIRKYNKDKIYFLGFNNKNKYYIYLNNRLELICRSKKIVYINIEKPIINQLY